MAASTTLRDVFLREAFLGVVVCLTLLAVTFLPGTHLGLIEGLFLLAPWILVPLGATLLPHRTHSRDLAIVSWMLPPAAVLVTASFFVERGALSAGLASAWVGVCLLFVWDACRRIWTLARVTFTEFCFAVGEGYLIVAGTWLVASRAGLQPLGFQEPIVLLPAVHFHFAGEYPLQPFVDIRLMAEFHGVLNAVGFCLCGLWGWTRMIPWRPAETATSPPPGAMRRTSVGRILQPPSRDVQVV